MKEIYIDVENGSNNTIKVTQGDNLTETYTLILMKNRIRINLTDRKVKFAFVKSNSNHGDIFDEINISNPIEGEVELPITNKITKSNGSYSCGLAIYNSSGYLEHTGTFNLYVKENLFEKVSGKLLENSVYTELMSLLDKVTDINNNLTVNINEAKKTNDNATNLKNALENDINRADTLKNDLETGINKANPVNDSLIKNTSNAVEKNTTLNNSLNEAKKYISGLDGSQNIPQIRMDVTELQNGLKTNQELEYEGTNLKCENTFDGRIEDIVLEGRTYQNLFDTKNIIGDWKFPCKISANGNSYHKQYLTPLAKPNTEYTIIVKVSENTINQQFTLTGWNSTSNPAVITKNDGIGIFKRKITTKTNDFSTSWDMELWKENTEGFITIDWLVILEGDWINKEIPSYFEGIKSVGEKEEKIILSSNNKNLFDTSKMTFDGEWYSTDVVNTTLENPTKVKLKPNTKYTFSAKKISTRSSWVAMDLMVDGVGSILGNNGNNDFNYTFITPNGTDIYFMIRKNTPDDVVMLKDIQLEEGEKTDFENYKVNKREFKIDGGLKSLPNGAYDTLENRKDGTYLVERVKKIVFDGSDDESFGIAQNNAEIFIVQISSDGKTDSLTTISNHYMKHEFRWNVAEWSSRDYIGVNFSNTPGKLTLLFPKEKCPTLTDMSSFKTWLKNNPIILYYELQSPVETKISDSKLSLDTYNALTYVFSNNDISPNIKVKIASNLGSIIQQNAKSINDIYRLIDELIIPQVTQNTLNIELLKLK